MTTMAMKSSSEVRITPIKSKYLKTVCLKDWWLIKSADGKGLCMGGLEVTEKRVQRVFSSAPITARYGLIALKTADEINILIQGTINTSRTLENGFSSQVCSRFLLGFPYDWKNVLAQESAGNRASSKNMSSFDESKDVLSFLPNFLRGEENIGTILFPIPGTPVTSKDIRLDVPGNSGGNSNMLNSCDLRSSYPLLEDCLPVEVPCKKQRLETETNHECEKGSLNALDAETVANEDELLPNDEEMSTGVSCHEPEENIESASDDHYMNGKAVTAADLDLLATEETSIAEEDCVVPEGTREKEDNYLPNKQYNLNADANPSEASMVPPIDLQSSSEKFESSVSASKADKKTITNLESEGPENLRCSCDTGVDDVLIDAPVFIDSDLENADPSVGVPLLMTPSMKLAKAKGIAIKGKVGRPKKTNTSLKSERPENLCCSYGTGSSDVRNADPFEASVDVPVLMSPSTKLAKAKGEVAKGKVGRPKKKGMNSHSISGCSVEVGLDTSKVAPHKGAATRTSRKLNNIEGKGSKKRASNCSNENPGPMESFERPRKKFLIKTCVSNTSSCSVDSAKENMSSSTGRRASGRVNPLVNNLEDGRPTNNTKIQREIQKANFVSVGSDSVRTYVENDDGELGGTSTLLPFSGNKENLQCSSARERPNLNLKSRFGRLLKHPRFWSKQQDGQVAGFEGGPPIFKAPRGSKSEPQKAKRKLVLSPSQKNGSC